MRPDTLTQTRESASSSIAVQTELNGADLRTVEVDMHHLLKLLDSIIHTSGDAVTGSLNTRIDFAKDYVHTLNERLQTARAMADDIDHDMQSRTADLSHANQLIEDLKAKIKLQAIEMQSKHEAEAVKAQREADEDTIELRLKVTELESSLATASQLGLLSTAASACTPLPVRSEFVGYASVSAPVVDIALDTSDQRASMLTISGSAVQSWDVDLAKHSVVSNSTIEVDARTTLTSLIVSYDNISYTCHFDPFI